MEIFSRLGFPVSSSKSRGGLPINKVVKPFIFPIKRSQADSRSRGSLDRTFFSLFPELEDLVGNLVVKVLQEVAATQKTL